jgi:hypothetical protein
MEKAQKTRRSINKPDCVITSSSACSRFPNWKFSVSSLATPAQDKQKGDSVLISQDPKLLQSGLDIDRNPLT